MAGDGGTNEKLRSLPGVDRVMAALGDGAPAPVVAEAARAVLDRTRAAILGGGEAPSFDDIVTATRETIDRGAAIALHPVINGTGVLIHTNLGRAPLGPRQLDAIRAVAGGYSNLEYDIEKGSRGTRYSHSRGALTALTGAESTIVVNNNAAAVLLAISAIGRDREVIISRGELIEIGGEFRIPDVIAASGARLVEVGTTNRTHLADYERAIGPNTAAILKVHPSNYRVVGFTADVPSRELVRLARGRGLCFVYDVGSGLIEGPEAADWATQEPSVAALVQEGADLVTFSGDKLFGGPQAGIVAGRRDLIEKLEKHPLMRALRVDKMTLAALDATADAYLRRSMEELPLWKLALESLDSLQERAEAIAQAVGAGTDMAVKVEATQTLAVPGGGSLPGAQVPSWGVSISGTDVDGLHSRLRNATPSLVARIADDRLIVDLRTVFRDQDELVEDALKRAIGP